MGLERPLMYFLDEQGEPAGIDHEDAFSDARMRDWYDHYRDKPGPRSKRVAADTVDDWWVSTVFLSIDHQFGSGPPVLWETMVFKGAESDQYCERYTSREDALRGHARVVAALLAGKTPDDLADERS